MLITALQLAALFIIVASSSRQSRPDTPYTTEDDSTDHDTADGHFDFDTAKASEVLVPYIKIMAHSFKCLPNDDSCALMKVITTLRDMEEWLVTDLIHIYSRRNGKSLL